VSRKALQVWKLAVFPHRGEKKPHRMIRKKKGGEWVTRFPDRWSMKKRDISPKVLGKDGEIQSGEPQKRYYNTKG